MSQSLTAGFYSRTKFYVAPFNSACVQRIVIICIPSLPLANLLSVIIPALFVFTTSNSCDIIFLAKSKNASMIEKNFRQGKLCKLLLSLAVAATDFI